VAQLLGVALAAGIASLESGFQIGFIAAAAVTMAGALTVAVTVPPGR
jgi:F0F1-type ATP synthase membrane subunit c/vacuolar-type H+-ATPase subunit K